MKKLAKEVNMPSKKEDADKKEMDKMDKSFEKATGMKVVPPNPQNLGKTTFAKDEKVKP
jgi:hypothetical protein